MKVAESCPTLCHLMDYIVHEILQARILKWVVVSFSRGSSQSRDFTQISCTAGELSHHRSPYQMSYQRIPGIHGVAISLHPQQIFILCVFQLQSLSVCEVVSHCDWFSFHWWLIILSIYSYTCWPLYIIFWKDVFRCLVFNK